MTCIRRILKFKHKKANTCDIHVGVFGAFTVRTVLYASLYTGHRVPDDPMILGIRTKPRFIIHSRTPLYNHQM